MNIMTYGKIQYCNVTKEMVKILNQICVFCSAIDSVHDFRQCGHDCVCEICYDFNEHIILRCVVRRVKNNLSELKSGIFNKTYSLTLICSYGF